MKILSLWFGLMLFSSGAMAEEIHLKDRFGIGAGAGAAIPVINSFFKSNASTGISLNGHLDYYLWDALGFEFEYQRLNFKAAEPATNAYTLGVLYRFAEDAAFSPTLGLGAGFADTSGSPFSELNFKGWIGTGKLGLDFALNQNVIFALTGKYNWAFSSSAREFNEHSISPELEITYFFGAPKEAEATPAPVAAIVNEIAKVDGDDDQDGVLNSVDQCPGTPKGTKVNSIGCAVEEKVDYTIKIEFDSGKSTVKEEYNSELQKFATLLKEHTDLSAEIQGYTDNKGKKASNLKLSAARAKSVKDYLVNTLGADGSRLTSKGFGQDNPIADNATAEGRAQNRRVVASLRSK